MDRNLVFSGQLFFRERGPAIELDLSTRTLFALSGIIAVPKNFNLKGEHQYPIAGFDSVHSPMLTIGKEGIDLTEHARGKSIGGLLTTPIWKI